MEEVKEDRPWEECHESEGCMEHDDAASSEIMEKIGKRSIELVSGFFNLVEHGEAHTKETTPLMIQIEISALMHTAATITASIIYSIHRQGGDMHQLLKDHTDTLGNFIEIQEGESFRSSKEKFVAQTLEEREANAQWRRDENGQMHLVRDKI